MPTVIVVDGVRIVIYPDDHEPPHYHAWKDGRDAQFEIETGRLMNGTLDRRSVRKVQAWTESNRDLLMTMWWNTRTGPRGTTKS